MIKLHTLKNTVPRKPRKRVGRGTGGNWGKTCGRGEKGQMSRSGAKRRPYFEGGQIPLFRRLPKKGFNNPNHKFYDIINIRDLEKHFQAGDTVDVEKLKSKSLIGKSKWGVKILGEGDISKALTVKEMLYSSNAKEKIVAAGGTCEEKI